MRYERKLSDVLSSLYRTMELDELADEFEVKSVYRQVVGDLISKLTMEVRYDKGVLVVKYSSAALKNEIAYKKQDLINKINDSMNRVVVRKLIIL
ncbi:MAG: DUF721 domain-containing protein [Bacteroidales bacterium]|nr:DUF721 domain-containing protein [Bacteroidales bacterium]